ncbi:hypothetical protein T439DRAFT_335030 [Meredithblackwellia eburnea MCA 4105]
MARGGGNSRQRQLDEDKGPSSAKLRGLSWNQDAAKPAFLRNAYSALAGPSSAKKQEPEWDGTGRPPIPTRPGGDDGQEEESEEDEWDMGRGDEAPTVVVLKEGKHLDRDEVDKLRAQARANSELDPMSSAAAPAGKERNTGSLSFSTDPSSSKRKLAEEDTSQEWSDVIKRSKVDSALLKEAEEAQKKAAAKDKEKLEKKKKKEKKENKKKIGMLSFNED